MVCVNKLKITALCAGLFTLCSPPAQVFGDTDVERSEFRYVVVTSSCVQRQRAFTLELVFDQRLEQSEVLFAVGNALQRDELKEVKCSKPVALKTNDLDGSIATIAKAVSRFIVVVYSGNMPGDMTSETPTFVHTFSTTKPVITIGNGGKWRIITRGDSSRQHPPPMIGYRSPFILMSCPVEDRNTHYVPSDYLVQVITVECDDAGSEFQELVFLGLGAFASETSGKTEPQLSIHGAAYLALEFEVYRAVVALLK